MQIECAHIVARDQEGRNTQRTNGCRNVAMCALSVVSSWIIRYNHQNSIFTSLWNLLLRKIGDLEKNIQNAHFDHVLASLSWFVQYVSILANIWTLRQTKPAVEQWQTKLGRQGPPSQVILSTSSQWSASAWLYDHYHEHHHQHHHDYLKKIICKYRWVFPITNTHFLGKNWWIFPENDLIYKGKLVSSAEIMFHTKSTFWPFVHSRNLR